MFECYLGAKLGIRSEEKKIVRMSHRLLVFSLQWTILCLMK